jgi:hypothetical protein
MLNDKDRRVMIKRLNPTAEIRMHKRLVFDSLQEVARNNVKNEKKIKMSIIVFFLIK